MPLLRTTESQTSTMSSTLQKQRSRKQRQIQNWLLLSTKQQVRVNLNEVQRSASQGLLAAINHMTKIRLFDHIKLL